MSLIRVTGITQINNLMGSYWDKHKIWDFSESLRALERDISSGIYWYLTIDGIDVSQMQVDEIALLLKLLG